MDKQQLKTFVDSFWDKQITPVLMDYVKIPCKSPMFDQHWEQNGYIEQAIELMHKWCEQNTVPKMQMEVLRLPNRTPVLYVEIPGQQDGTVLLYGHLDKQPEMIGWHDDLGPWKPVLKNDRLYGRGSGDDGYALFSALTAIKALQEQNISHPRCVILIEACEESGSYDLPFYIDHIKNNLGEPKLVVCLDSGCGNYDQLWCTTSLRGIIAGTLTIEILKEGLHSGIVGGIVPTTSLILRQLLSRIEDEKTGTILPDELKVEIPEQRLEEAKIAAELLKKEVYAMFPFCEGSLPLSENPEQLILNNTWRSSLAITGIAGLPPLENAGNVIIPKLQLQFSMRVPPTCDVESAAVALKKLLEKDPPFGAKIHFHCNPSGPGWNVPELTKHTRTLLENASQDYFGKSVAYMGIGATIPFMGMLSEKLPSAQFLVTGVLGPQSNAHGPNEFLHIPTAKKVTCCVAQIIAELNTN